MSLINIKISDEQAKTIAFDIYKDIAEYIKAHQEEYQKFLMQREKDVKSA